MAQWNESPAFNFNGIPGFILVSQRRTRSPLYGFGYELRFRGKPEAINAAFLSVAGDQTAILDESGPVHELVVQTPDDPTKSTDGVIATSYELMANGQQKDIYEHPKSLALGQTALNAIRAELKKDNPNVSNITGTNAKALFTLLLEGNGSRSYQTSGYVFRITRVLSARSGYQVAFSNIERIYTTAQLITEVSPPSGILFSLDAIAADPPDGANSAGYIYGWLKQTPTVSIAAGTKTSVQNEWWLENWTTYSYRSAA